MNRSIKRPHKYCLIHLLTYICSIGGLKTCLKEKDFCNCELQAELTIHFMELCLYFKEQLTNYPYSSLTISHAFS